MSLFALPVVGRAGLGNMLFPWARAEIFARQTGARILKPVWNTVRLGPYLRREPEKRNYFGLFRAPHHLHGVSRMMSLLTGNRVLESERESATIKAKFPYRHHVVVFKGLDKYFGPLLPEYAFIRDQLWIMTRERMRATGSVYGERFIAMHIRRGDLTRQGLGPEELNAQAPYTPIAWFASMARAVRRCPELDSVPIVMFTDGSADEVAEVLNIDDIHLHRRGTAIADLWALAHARLLFATGFSTFSMWASFLGGMPTIYAPGKIQQYVQTGRPHAVEIELEEGADIPPDIQAMTEG
jgi:hypothetical protein